MADLVAADVRFDAFLSTAKASYARSVAIVAHGWTTEDRKKFTELNRGEVRTILDGWARKAIADVVPAGDLTPQQFDQAAIEVVSVGLDVMDAALRSEPGVWVFTCADCFQIFTAEIMVELGDGAAAKFKPPEGWCCPECEPSMRVEVGRV